MTKNKCSFVEGPLIGRCLIAVPSGTDEQFEKSVVYICSADDKEGVMGIVFNKPLYGIGFKDVFEQINVPEGKTEKYPPVFWGGPVEESRGFLLHSSDYETSQTLKITDDIFLTSTVDALMDIAKGKGPKEKLFALGYANWNPGRLEIEMMANSWLMVPATPELVFQTKPADKWEKAIRMIGIDPLMLSLEQGSV